MEPFALSYPATNKVLNRHESRKILRLAYKQLINARQKLRQINEMEQYVTGSEQDKKAWSSDKDNILRQISVHVARIDALTDPTFK